MSNTGSLGLNQNWTILFLKASYLKFGEGFGPTFHDTHEWTNLKPNIRPSHLKFLKFDRLSE